ncbi:MAG: transglycosylase domain-containing protein [Thermoanaerobaculia bacterium]|nr:transglycosylase domain-containing protein [Thermoanaerobaculia bacterium]
MSDLASGAMKSDRAGTLFAVIWLTTMVVATPVWSNPLLDELGRSETRVWSEPFTPGIGGSVEGYRLAERLDRIGYQRVHERPEHAGQYFWGHDVFWIFRRSHRVEGVQLPEVLFALELDRHRDGRVSGFRSADGERLDRAPRLEPELLAESLDGDRAVRHPLRFDSLPEHVWRPLLAAEDSRFFDHPGLDGKSLARALLANLRAGKTVQGGSTITQQLVKNRELTPKRTLGRKVSEAVRTLAVEAEYSKREILETYLATVYLGHVDGLAVHGYGTAARAYFGRDATELDLVQSATLAAMIQAPNRLDPERRPDAVKTRRDWVLGRLGELGWASADEIARARRQPVRLTRREPRKPPARLFMAWLREEASNEAPVRLEKGRGVVVESTLDPLLQEQAEKAVADHLHRLRRQHRSLRNAPLQAALVTLDARNGAVLAHVGGDPRKAEGFDRVRKARRQPGSAIKPLLLLEAFDDCGGEPLHPATRVADEPLRLELPSGPWEPSNSDDRFRGAVSIRLALRHSLNVPFVRVVEHCGRTDTASALRRAGLQLPEPVPPSFALGAVETSPLQLARAYTSLQAGRSLEPRPWRRMERPGGRRLGWEGVDDVRVASEEAAFLVRHLLTDVADLGTASTARIDDVEVAAKTGTTSDRRDAWLAGLAHGLVTVVWVGRDDDQPHGLTGSVAAAPLWRDYMEHAVRLRPPLEPRRPPGIEVRWVDPRTGLRVGRGHSRAEPELFRKGVKPRRKRWWRKDPPTEVIR